eukprot:6274731-Prorocentrum_lima.AAC.1
MRCQHAQEFCYAPTKPGLAQNGGTSVSRSLHTGVGARFARLVPAGRCAAEKVPGSRHREQLTRRHMCC